ncbi:Dna-directed Rna polymerase III RPC6 [Cardiosporidium cionae]|uniref:Dna-directed Rna polymerase III RPC6 n=1 Tax=Cardiosporidium cionae TaxID=476202 RepID=A0ABQ7JC39_9APIC|nr:Dna-directed Rna polymerase III RPC6 [Cardiosporidium cionae]|eukprot:KAF8821582.1 Dna-directed Rna polymerase III RPC6 [Cardiosporidium cionae]
MRAIVKSMAAEIQTEDLQEAYTLGRSNSDEITQEILRGRNWETAKILAVFNRMVEARVCSLRKTRNGHASLFKLFFSLKASEYVSDRRFDLKSDENRSIWCKIRPEHTIQIIKTLDANDYRIYCTIEEAGNRGIWTADIRKQTGLQSHQVQKSVKNLCEAKQLIKPVKNIHVKNRKVYMLTEVEPAKEIAGGSFYVNSEFNNQLVEHLRDQIIHYLRSGQVATLQTISSFVRSSGGLKTDVSNDDIRSVIRTLEYDQKVLESKSAATGDSCFAVSNFVCADSICNQSSEGSVAYHENFARSYILHKIWQLVSIFTRLPR